MCAFAASHDTPRYTFGTHRARTPEATLALLPAAMATVGVTRVADVTGLDRLGIPVYQAIRPLSRSLSVSQGKGLTRAAAKVSAVMESVELWHAETAEPAATAATVREMQLRLPYAVDSLALRERTFFHPGLTLEWIEARGVISGRPTFVPRDLAIRDRRVKRRFSPPVFHASSNGLSSGNTLAEALVHGLCELIERDSTERARVQRVARARPLDRASIGFEPWISFSDVCAREGVLAEVFNLTGPTGVPVFYVSLWSSDLPVYFMGWGCHMSKDIALARAFTEAAQSRLTVIAGARDDLEASYHWTINRTRAPEPSRSGLDYADVASLPSGDFADDLRSLAQKIVALTGFEPLVVELTRPDVGIPVAHVVAPGLRPHRRYGP